MVKHTSSLVWRIAVSRRGGAMVLLAHAVWAFVGCSSSPGMAPSQSCQVTPRYQLAYPARPKLDLLFTMDDSPAMAPVRDKLTSQLPRFVEVLQGLPGGSPDLHLAVVSTSLASSQYPSLPGCERGSRGDGGGKFRHPSGCTVLAAGQNYLAVNEPDRNFTGDLTAAVQCLADVGANGCPFPQPLAATRLALEKGANPLDSDNGGFLRADAQLMILLITNQDDCSVPDDSDLFDPLQMTPADPLGAFTPYRCQEFGHRCNGLSPPHQVTTAVSLDGCIPAEDGRLTPVQEFITFMRGLKSGEVLVAVLAGPSHPYVVGPSTVISTNGGISQVPVVLPSCLGGPPAAEYGAQPAIRIKQWLDGLGANAALQSLCADDSAQVLARFVSIVGDLAAPPCITEAVASRGDGTPDCDVVEVVGGAAARARARTLPLCERETTKSSAEFPCWRLATEPSVFCPTGRAFEICWEAACHQRDPHDWPREGAEVTFQCALSPHC